MRNARALGLAIAVVGLILDQASKWAILATFADPAVSIIPVTFFFDLVLVWNYGISYGLFQAGTQGAVWFLVALQSSITAVLLVWLWRNASRFVALALGLVIGGALGNTLDRVIHGAVVDFVSLHAAGFHWYVFNLADVWVVAGVGLLLYEAFIVGGDEKTA